MKAWGARAKAPQSACAQRGGFVLGLVVGLLVGLAVALGVALYITKAPVPFVNKVPQRTAEQDRAESERNRQWDPNGPLATRAGGSVGAASAPTAASAASAADAGGPPAAAASAPGRDPAAILSGGAPASTGKPSAEAAKASAPAAKASAPDPFVYFVQVGAFTRPEDAEQQRARVALAGVEAKLSEREQAGRTVYRVRVGPFETREAAEAMQTRLTTANFDARLVRVERT